MKITSPPPALQTDNQRPDPVMSDPQKQQREATIKGPNPAVEQGASLIDTEAALEQLNRTTEVLNISLRFKVHEDSERMMVQVVDTHSDEIIKEMPPENLLNVVAQIQNMVGLMLDARR